MALTKIKNTSLEDADLVTLAGNDGTNLTGVVKSANDLSDLDSAVTALTNLGLTSTAAELNILDGVTSTTAELNILDGVTSTAAELNILDGVTSTAAELNILDGVTASTTELNYVDGVTSLIQGQIDNITTDLVADATPQLGGNLDIQSYTIEGVDATELAILDGATLSTTELNYVDGVTSLIQTQINGKEALPSLKSANYTAVAGDTVLVTAGSITITLPASPTAGDTVIVKDGTGAAATTNWTVGRNGSNIASSASNLTFDKNWTELCMTYINSTIGWSI